mgnify:CR=1 FL=1
MATNHGKRKTPYDLGESRVLDTRISKNGLLIRRRRECLKTGRRFTTQEQIVREGVFVLKRDGTREPFEREKMIRGLQKATEKRPIEAEQIEMIINDVMEDLEQKHDTEIPASAIGEAIMQQLRVIDHIAYVRFASVYKDFRDIEELRKDIENLSEGR